MKSEFKVKYLQHLVKKRKDEGFTLIELLVVIIIIGILAAIALPSFLNQANKAKESESKTYVGSMNRTQQAYFLEKNTFSSDVSLLGLGVNTQTTNYTYSINGASRDQVVNYSSPQNTTTLRAHTGGVQVGQTGTGTSTETTTKAILCQSQRPAAGNTGGVTLAPNTATDPVCNTPDFEPLN